MDLRPEFIDLTKPNDLLALKKHLSEMADELDILYTTTAPNGTISARQGRIALYNNGGTYSYWLNTTGSTVWVEMSNQTMWQVDGTETQLKTADEIDMQSKKIINVTDPTAAQEASTKAYTDTKISKTTAGEIAAMTEKTTLVDADLFLIEDSAAGNAKKKVQKSNLVGNPLKLKSATAITTDNSGDIAISPSKIYKVIISLTNISADDTVALRFNSDSTNNYDVFRDGVNTIGAVAATRTGATATSGTLGQMDVTDANKKLLLAELLIDTNAVGARSARAIGQVYSFQKAGAAEFVKVSIDFTNTVTISSFEILTTGASNMTGNVYVYEMPLS